MTLCSMFHISCVPLCFMYFELLNIVLNIYIFILTRYFYLFFFLFLFKLRYLIIYIHIIIHALKYLKAFVCVHWMRLTAFAVIVLLFSALSLCYCFCLFYTRRRSRFIKTTTPAY